MHHDTGPRHPIELETERLALTRPDARDAEDIAKLASNWAVLENLTSLPHPYGPDDARAWIERSAQGADSDASFVIRLKRLEPELIGVIGYGRLNDDVLGHFGYWLGEPYWGRGYATEAALAVLAHAFDRLAIAEIHTACRPGNAGSRHVLAKCGFDLVGTGTMNSLPLKSKVPMLKYTLTRKAWRHRLPVTNRAGSG